jgi:hypothetical protein
MFTFRPKTKNHGEIVAEAKKGIYYFSDVYKVKYQWLGELTSEHAQRVANEFAANISRVGLDESEWLRLKAKG